MFGYLVMLLYKLKNIHTFVSVYSVKFYSTITTLNNFKIMPKQTILETMKKQLSAIDA